MYRPNVGMGIILLDNSRVLIGKRKNSHGRGTWSTPGGHLEAGERLIECAYRELQEETGLNALVVDKSPCAVTNDIFSKELHYVTLFMRMKYVSGEPRVIEPDSCEQWKWVKWAELQKMEMELFLPIQNLLKLKYSPFK